MQNAIRYLETLKTMRRACYFLLNYAKTLLQHFQLVQQYILLFSFELCIAKLDLESEELEECLACYFLLNYAGVYRIWVRDAKWILFDLLFSFELCQICTICHTPASCGSCLAIFF